MHVGWENLNDSITFSSFSTCWNRNRSALVRDSLSNNSKLVSRLIVDKSLGLRVPDLTFVTTDLKTVIHYSTNHC